MSKKEFNARHSSTGSTPICARGSHRWRLITWSRISVMEWSCWLCWRFSQGRDFPWSEAESSDGRITWATSTRLWSSSVARGWVWQAEIFYCCKKSGDIMDADCLDLSPSEWHLLSAIRNTLWPPPPVFCQIYFLPQIKLVNINASDVVDGKSAVVLGLIWTIILYFQVIFHQEQTNLLWVQTWQRIDIFLL